MRKQRFSPIVRSLAAILSVALLWQDLLYADALQSLNVSPSLAVTRKSSHEPGKTDNEIVINIQDAHASLGAQKSIAKILDLLAKDYDLNLIGVEGSSGALDTAAVSSFPIEAIRRDAAESLLSETKISAAEFYKIISGNDVELHGLESADLYRENVESYQKLLSAREAISRELSKLEKFLRGLEPVIFSEDVAKVIESSRKHAAGDLAFTDYWKVLEPIAVRAGVSVEEYPNSSKLVKTGALEATIDFTRAEMQRDKLVEKLRAVAAPKDFEQVILKALEFKVGKITPGIFYTELLAFAGKSAVDLSEYPDLVSYSRYVSVFESIDLADFFGEIEAWEASLKESLFISAEERQLDHGRKLLEILPKVLQANLSSSEYAFYLKNRTAFSAESLQSLWSTFVVKAQDQPEFPDIDLLASYIPAADVFYEKVQARNDALLKNLLTRMRQSGRRVAALVTGGFHSEPLSDLMRERKVSHLVVMPKFDEKEGERPYLAVITLKGSFMDLEIRKEEQRKAIALLVGLAILEGFKLDEAKKLYLESYESKAKHAIRSDIKNSNASVSSDNSLAGSNLAITGKMKSARFDHLATTSVFAPNANGAAVLSPDEVSQWVNSLRIVRKRGRQEVVISAAQNAFRVSAKKDGQPASVSEIELSPVEHETIERSLDFSSGAEGARLASISDDEFQDVLKDVRGKALRKVAVAINGSAVPLDEVRSRMENEFKELLQIHMRQKGFNGKGLPAHLEAMVETEKNGAVDEIVGRFAPEIKKPEAFRRDHSQWMDRLTGRVESNIEPWYLDAYREFVRMSLTKVADELGRDAQFSSETIEDLLIGISRNTRNFTPYAFLSLPAGVSALREAAPSNPEQIKDLLIRISASAKERSDQAYSLLPSVLASTGASGFGPLTSNRLLSALNAELDRQEDAGLKTFITDKGIRRLSLPEQNVEASEEFKEVLGISQRLKKSFEGTEIKLVGFDEVDLKVVFGMLGTKDLSRVAFDDEGDIEGFLGVGKWVMNDGTFTPYFIHNIGVDPERRGGGIGRRLFHSLAHEVFQRDPQAAIYLEVEADNKDAIAWYTKIGFKLRESYASALYPGVIFEVYEVPVKTLFENTAPSVEKKVQDSTPEKAARFMRTAGWTGGIAATLFSTAFIIFQQPALFLAFLPVLGELALLTLISGSLLISFRDSRAAQYLAVLGGPLSFAAFNTFSSDSTLLQEIPQLSQSLFVYFTGIFTGTLIHKWLHKKDGALRSSFRWAFGSTAIVGYVYYLVYVAFANANFKAPWDMGYVSAPTALLIAAFEVSVFVMFPFMFLYGLVGTAFGEAEEKAADRDWRSLTAATWQTLLSSYPVAFLFWFPALLLVWSSASSLASIVILIGLTEIIYQYIFLDILDLVFSKKPPILVPADAPQDPSHVSNGPQGARLGAEDKHSRWKSLILRSGFSFFIIALGLVSGCAPAGIRAAEVLGAQQAQEKYDNPENLQNLLTPEVIEKLVLTEKNEAIPSRNTPLSLSGNNYSQYWTVLYDKSAQNAANRRQVIVYLANSGEQRAIPYLLRNLLHADDLDEETNYTYEKDASVRAYSAWALGKLTGALQEHCFWRSDRHSVVDYLVKALNDPDPSVRENSAIALARIPLTLYRYRQNQYVDLRVDALGSMAKHDQEPAARLKAVFALGEIYNAQIENQGIDQILNEVLSRERNMHVRMVAASIIGRHQMTASTRMLVKNLSDHPTPATNGAEYYNFELLRRAVFNALWYVAKKDRAQAVNLLRQAIRQELAAGYYQAVNQNLLPALSTLVEAKEYQEELAEISKLYPSVSFAIPARSDVPKELEETFSALTRPAALETAHKDLALSKQDLGNSSHFLIRVLLTDPNDDRRSLAAVKLGEWTESKPVESALMQVLSDVKLQLPVQIAALRSLDRIRVSRAYPAGQDPLFNVLVKLLDSKSWAVRAWAVKIASDRAADNGQAFSVLAPALSDEHPAVRTLAMFGAKKAGNRGSALVGPLLESLARIHWLDPKTDDEFRQSVDFIKATRQSLAAIAKSTDVVSLLEERIKTELTKPNPDTVSLHANLVPLLMDLYTDGLIDTDRVNATLRRLGLSPIPTMGRQIKPSYSALLEDSYDSYLRVSDQEKKHEDLKNQKDPYELIRTLLTDPQMERRGYAAHRLAEFTGDRRVLMALRQASAQGNLTLSALVPVLRSLGSVTNEPIYLAGQDPVAKKLFAMFDDKDTHWLARAYAVRIMTAQGNETETVRVVSAALLDAHPSVRLSGIDAAATSSASTQAYLKPLLGRLAQIRWLDAKDAASFDQASQEQKALIQTILSISRDHADAVLAELRAKIEEEVAGRGQSESLRTNLLPLIKKLSDEGAMNTDKTHALLVAAGFDRSVFERSTNEALPAVQAFLGRYGKSDFKEAVPGLTDFLSDLSENKPTPDDLKAITDPYDLVKILLLNESPQLSVQAIRRLAELETPEGSAAILKILNNKDVHPSVTIEALRVMSHLGAGKQYNSFGANHPLIPVLDHLIRSGSQPIVRAQAVFLASSLSTSDESARLVAAGLSDTDLLVRLVSAESAGALSTRALPLIDPLLDRLVKIGTPDAGNRYLYRQAQGEVRAATESLLKIAASSPDMKKHVANQTRRKLNESLAAGGSQTGVERALQVLKGILSRDEFEKEVRTLRGGAAVPSAQAALPVSTAVRDYEEKIARLEKANPIQAAEIQNKKASADIDGLLVLLLYNNSPAARALAARALGELDPSRRTETVSALVAAYEKEKNLQVRIAIIRVLADRMDPTQILGTEKQNPLISVFGKGLALKDTDPLERIHLILGLANLQDPNAAVPLVHAFELLRGYKEKYRNLQQLKEYESLRDALIEAFDRIGASAEDELFTLLKLELRRSASETDLSLLHYLSTRFSDNFRNEMRSWYRSRTKDAPDFSIRISTSGAVTPASVSEAIDNIRGRESEDVSSRMEALRKANPPKFEDISKKISDVRSIRRFEPLLTDADPETRAIAAYLLAQQTDDYAVVGALSQAAGKGKNEDPLVLASIVWAIAQTAPDVSLDIDRWKDPVLPILKELSKNDSWAVRANTALAIGRSGDVDGAPILEELLKSNERYVTVRAIQAAGEFLSKRYDERLVRALLEILAQPQQVPGFYESNLLSMQDPTTEYTRKVLSDVVERYRDRREASLLKGLLEHYWENADGRHTIEYTHYVIAPLRKALSPDSSSGNSAQAWGRWAGVMIRTFWWIALAIGGGLAYVASRRIMKRRSAEMSRRESEELIRPSQDLDLEEDPDEEAGDNNQNRPSGARLASSLSSLHSPPEEVVHRDALLDLWRSRLENWETIQRSGSYLKEVDVLAILRLQMEAFRVNDNFSFNKVYIEDADKKCQEIVLLTKRTYNCLTIEVKELDKKSNKHLAAKQRRMLGYMRDTLNIQKYFLILERLLQQVADTKDNLSHKLGRVLREIFFYDTGLHQNVRHLNALILDLYDTGNQIFAQSYPQFMGKTEEFKRAAVKKQVNGFIEAMKNAKPDRVVKTRKGHRRWLTRFSPLAIGSMIALWNVGQLVSGNQEFSMWLLFWIILQPLIGLLITIAVHHWEILGGLISETMRFNDRMRKHDEVRAKLQKAFKVKKVLESIDSPFFRLASMNQEVGRMKSVIEASIQKKPLKVILMMVDENSIEQVRRVVSQIPLIQRAGTPVVYITDQMKNVGGSFLATVNAYSKVGYEDTFKEFLEKLAQDPKSLLHNPGLRQLIDNLSEADGEVLLRHSQLGVSYAGGAKNHIRDRIYLKGLEELSVEIDGGVTRLGLSIYELFEAALTAHDLGINGFWNSNANKVRLAPIHIFPQGITVATASASLEQAEKQGLCVVIMETNGTRVHKLHKRGTAKDIEEAHEKAERDGTSVYTSVSADNRTIPQANVFAGFWGGPMDERMLKYLHATERILDGLRLKGYDVEEMLKTISKITGLSIDGYLLVPNAVADKGFGAYLATKRDEVLKAVRNSENKKLKDSISKFYDQLAASIRDEYNFNEPVISTAIPSPNQVFFSEGTMNDFIEVMKGQNVFLQAKSGSSDSGVMTAVAAPAPVPTVDQDPVMAASPSPVSAAPAVNGVPAVRLMAESQSPEKTAERLERELRDSQWREKIRWVKEYLRPEVTRILSSDRTELEVRSGLERLEFETLERGLKFEAGIYEYDPIFDKNLNSEDKEQNARVKRFTDTDRKIVDVLSERLKEFEVPSEEFVELTPQEQVSMNGQPAVQPETVEETAKEIIEEVAATTTAVATVEAPQARLVEYSPGSNGSPSVPESLKGIHTQLLTLLRTRFPEEDPSSFESTLSELDDMEIFARWFVLKDSIHRLESANGHGFPDYSSFREKIKETYDLSLNNRGLLLQRVLDEASRTKLSGESVKQDAPAVTTQGMPEQAVTSEAAIESAAEEAVTAETVTPAEETLDPAEALFNKIEGSASQADMSEAAFVELAKDARVELRGHFRRGDPNRALRLEEFDALVKETSRKLRRNELLRKAFEAGVPQEKINSRTPDFRIKKYTEDIVSERARESRFQEILSAFEGKAADTGLSFRQLQRVSSQFLRETRALWKNSSQENAKLSEAQVRTKEALQAAREREKVRREAEVLRRKDELDRQVAAIFRQVEEESRKAGVTVDSFKASVKGFPKVLVALFNENESKEARLKKEELTAFIASTTEAIETKVREKRRERRLARVEARRKAKELQTAIKAALPGIQAQERSARIRAIEAAIDDAGKDLSATFKSFRETTAPLLDELRELLKNDPQGKEKFTQAQQEIKEYLQAFKDREKKPKDSGARTKKRRSGARLASIVVAITTGGRNEFEVSRDIQALAAVARQYSTRRFEALLIAENGSEERWKKIASTSSPLSVSVIQAQGRTLKKVLEESASKARIGILIDENNGNARVMTRSIHQAIFESDQEAFRGQIRAVAGESALKTLDRAVKSDALEELLQSLPREFRERTIFNLLPEITSYDISFLEMMKEKMPQEDFLLTENEAARVTKGPQHVIITDQALEKELIPLALQKKLLESQLGLSKGSLQVTLALTRSDSDAAALLEKLEMSGMLKAGDLARILRVTPQDSAQADASDAYRALQQAMGGKLDPTAVRVIGREELVFNAADVNPVFAESNRDLSVVRIEGDAPMTWAIVTAFKRGERGRLVLVAPKPVDLDQIRQMLKLAGLVGKSA